MKSFQVVTSVLTNSTEEVQDLNGQRLVRALLLYHLAVEGRNQEGIREQSESSWILPLLNKLTLVKPTLIYLLHSHVLITLALLNIFCMSIGHLHGFFAGMTNSHPLFIF